MKYRLGRIDHGFVPRKLTVSYVAVCAGEVDIAGLRTAFGLLCDKYPMLRGTIEITGEQCWLHIPDDGSSAAATEIVQGAISDWLERGLTVLDPARGLAKLTIVAEGEQTAVALQVSHAINDAPLGLALLEHFWHTVAALAEGAAFPDPAPVHPRSLEHAYRARSMTLPDLAVAAAGPVHSTPTADIGSGAVFAPEPAQRITLSQGDTAALLAHARASGTTLHALLAAAIIRAERATLTESAGAAAELPMIMFHLVDLRPHLRPVARPDEVTNALGFAPTVTACGPGSDLGVLAKETKAQIVAGIESGSALAVMRAAASGAAQGSARTGVGNFITNWGLVPELAVPAGIEIVDFRGFAISEAVTWVGYFVSTFSGRCSIELASCPRYHRRVQVAQLRELIIAGVAELTRPAPHSPVPTTEASSSVALLDKAGPST
ncbi:phthiocerol/phthiodiolone dimycocerosyl transferase family protein [Streptomyces lasiicapitis]|uniref:phthiocerol/phthiodiolone dimycocerosyl transferase family protein n=1 Tax=Streptomyces lasiicapitis TaxID=1923961 RepID=UPI0036763A5B